MELQLAHAHTKSLAALLCRNRSAKKVCWRLAWFVGGQGKPLRVRQIAACGDLTWGAWGMDISFLMHGSRGSVVRRHISQIRQCSMRTHVVRVRIPVRAGPKRQLFVLRPSTDPCLVARKKGRRVPRPAGNSDAVFFSAVIIVAVGSFALLQLHFEL